MTPFHNALLKGLNVPLKRYYLADTGYSNNAYTLIPFRGIRYHLKDFDGDHPSKRPQNKQELFNLYYA